MRILSVLVLWIMSLQATAQPTTSPYAKFGKITVEDLQRKVYPIDSNANAVVLSDIGQAAVGGNSKGWFSITFKRHRVVHILNKNGYDEANVEVSLYTNKDDEEKLENVKAVTYTLENGKIVETKLDKNSIFKEKKNANWVVKKFTMPNIKEGCIIEYDYKVTSDFIWNLDPWYFQGDAPVLWSEYELSIPQFFSYAFMMHGYLRPLINDRKNRQESFTVTDTRTAGATDRTSFTSGVTDYRWVVTDAPELKEESFTSTVKNHISRIEFQLAAQSEPLAPRDFRNNWPALTHSLLESDYFGNALTKDNNWLSDEMKPLLAGAASPTEKARKIYAYVRDNFTCVDHNALYADQSLKNVFKARKGNVSEINLLLTAMLRYAGLDANPVILSTTDHGYALPTYPMITSFNYVVTQLNANNNSLYLDATHPKLGFGKMLPSCYNGHARVVDEMATGIELSADSIREKKVTAVFISNDDKGQWVGSLKQTSGYYESYAIRQKIKDGGKEDFFKEMQKQFGMDIKIRQPGIDSIDNLDEPLGIHYDIEFNPASEDVIYVNPMFGEGYKNNPFKSAERYYPVEMPYTFDETFLLTMEVPAGYVVDEVPKQVVAKMDEQESGYFEYRLSQSGSTISMRCRIKIGKTLFLPDEYETLREFFNLIVNKQNEQIVFKKKK